MEELKAVIYARYSSSNQREESIEGQIRECTEYAEKNGITIIRSYIDRAKSARTANRPEFQKMVSDSNSKMFDIVLVYKLDRFSRDMDDSAIYKHILKQNGVKVVSAMEDITDSPESKLLEGVLTGLAQYYSAELSQKVKRGLKENALKGKKNGGTVPLGYTLNTETKKLEIDIDTAPIIREVFCKYADGCTMRSIVDSLNSRGFRTRAGKPFTTNSFHLENRTYIGEYKSQGVIIKDGNPAIIDEDTFNRVQARKIKNRQAAATGKAKVDYLLSTKLFCGECGGAMVGESGTSMTGRTYHYYKCTNAKRKKGCHKKAIKKEWIEKAVVSLTLNFVLNPQFQEKLINTILKIQDQEDTTTPALRNQLFETEKKIANIIKAIEQGVITPSITQHLETLENQKNEIKKSLQTAELLNHKLTREQLTEWFDQFFNEDLQNLQFQKKIIDIFINAVYIYDDKVVLTYNYKDSTQTISLAEIDSAISSDSNGISPPKRNDNFRLKIVVLLFYSLFLC